MLDKKQKICYNKSVKNKKIILKKEVYIMAITKKEVLTKAVGLEVFSEEEREVLQKMIKSLENKSSKPTKAQKENEGIKAEILAFIKENPGLRIGEIASATGYTPNKVNALVGQLKKAGAVERYEEKGVAYFK